MHCVQLYTYFTCIAGVNGDATVNIIRDTRDQSEKARHEETILSCDEFREFWITWTNASIDVGTGGRQGLYHKTNLFALVGVNPKFTCAITHLAHSLALRAL